MSAASERLRQERETFDLTKIHANRWFGLRLVTGYISIVLLLAIATTCIFVIFHLTHYSDQVIACTTSVLGANIIGTVLIVLKIVLNPASVTKLIPVTPITLAAK